MSRSRRVHPIAGIATAFLLMAGLFLGTAGAQGQAGFNVVEGVWKASRLTLEGDLSTPANASHDAAMSWVFAKGEAPDTVRPVTEHLNGTFIIVTQSWKTIGPQGPTIGAGHRVQRPGTTAKPGGLVGGVEILGLTPTTRQKTLELVLPAVYVDSIGRDAQWIVHKPMAHNATISAQLGALACDITITHPEGFKFGERSRAGRATGPADQWFPRAQCDAEGFRLSGQAIVIAFGMNFTIRHWTPEGERSHEVRSYSTTKPNATLPGIYDHELSYMRFLTAPDQGMSVLARGRINFTAPVLLGAGQVEFPSGEADLRWGEVKIEGEAVTTRMRGAFAFGSEGENAFSITGITTTAPPGLAAPANSPVATEGLWLLALIAALGVGSLSVSWPRWAPALFGLFTRITTQKALENNARRAVMDQIEARPGTIIKEVSLSLGLSRSVVRYHVGVLVRQGLITQRRLGRRTCLFPAGKASRLDALTLHLLKHPNAARIYHAISRSPEKRQRDIAAELGVTQPYVSQVIRQLREAGVEVGTRERRGSGPANSEGAAATS
jgi:DNA-binding transcriptional ArsR family regulator